MKDHYFPKHFTLVILLVSCYNLLSCTQADVIDQTCSKTSSPNLCATTLRSNPKSADADVKGLAGIMLDIVLAHTTDTLNFIRGQLNQAKDIPEKRALASCAETYNALVKFTIPQGIDFFNKGKYGIVEYTMMYNGKELQSCGKKLMPPSPVIDPNNSVENLTQIADGVLKQLLPPPLII